MGCSSTSSGRPPRLIVFGAVDIAASLCSAGARMPDGVRTSIDPRARFATPERFPDASRGDRRLARGGRRAAGRDRPRHLDRGPDPRPQARRRRARCSPCARRPGLSARWGRGGLRQSGASGWSSWGSATMSSSGYPRRSASTSARSARERDRAVDHGRDRRGPARARRRPAGRAQGADPRGARLICGLVLAAGAGTRFGERSKLLAELEGRPLLEHAIARPVRRGRTRARRGRARGVRRGDPGPGRLHAGRAGGLPALERGSGAVAAVRDRAPRRGRRRQPRDRHARRSAAGHARADCAVPGRAARHARRVRGASRATRWCSGPVQMQGDRAVCSGDQGARRLLDGATTIECGRF